jgi:hypothetical protein
MSRSSRSSGEMPSCLPPWVYCLLLFIPLVSLITLLLISGKASRVLKAYDIPVGFMGGKAGGIKD